MLVEFIIRDRTDSGDSIQGDIQLLSIGYILIIIYVAVMLGRLTRLNIKVLSYSHCQLLLVYNCRRVNCCLDCADSQGMYFLGYLWRDFSVTVGGS